METSVKNNQQYYAFGSKRGGDALATDHKFTGQKLDGSGLMYYNARYFETPLRFVARGIAN